MTKYLNRLKVVTLNKLKVVTLNKSKVVTLKGSKVATLKESKIAALKHLIGSQQFLSSTPLFYRHMNSIYKCWVYVFKNLILSKKERVRENCEVSPKHL